MTGGAYRASGRAREWERWRCAVGAVLWRLRLAAAVLAVVRRADEVRDGFCHFVLRRHILSVSADSELSIALHWSVWILSANPPVETEYPYTAYIRGRVKPKSYISAQRDMMDLKA